MPARIRRKGKCYQVRTPNRVHARCTTKGKAERQRRLLEAIDRDPNFRPRGSRR